MQVLMGGVMRELDKLPVMWLWLVNHVLNVHVCCTVELCVT